MRGIWLPLGVVLAVAACGNRTETVSPEGTTSSGAAGTVGSLALRGQVVVARPPGIQDAVEQVRREAAARCPGGFMIRSLRTDDPPPTSDFYYRLRTYEALVDCNPPPSLGGAR
jgi:hypothetical protein